MNQWTPDRNYLSVISPFRRNFQSKTKKYNLFTNSNASDDRRPTSRTLIHPMSTCQTGKIMSTGGKYDCSCIHHTRYTQVQLRFVSLIVGFIRLIRFEVQYGKCIIVIFIDVVHVTELCAQKFNIGNTRRNTLI